MLELSLSGWFTGTCVGALSSQSRNVGVITAVLTLIKHSFLNSIRLLVSVHVGLIKWQSKHNHLFFIHL